MYSAYKNATERPFAGGKMHCLSNNNYLILSPCGKDHYLFI